MGVHISFVPVCPLFVDERCRSCYIKQGSASHPWPACSRRLCCIDSYPVEFCCRIFLAETCLRFRRSFSVGMQAEATIRSALVLEVRSSVCAGSRNDHGATVVRLT